MIVYYPLWSLLRYYGFNRVYLLNCISTATLAKLGNNEIVSVDTIRKICEFLDCQPGDIMAYKKLDISRS